MKWFMLFAACPAVFNGFGEWFHMTDPTPSWMVGVLWMFLGIDCFLAFSKKLAEES